MRRLSPIVPLLLALVAPAARAGTILVTNLNDVAVGSLRQAVQDVAPGDTIRFAPGLNGTIANLGAPWQFNVSATVVGPGGNVLVLSGGSARRLFVVANGEVRISGLTLRDALGTNGPAIDSNDTLRVTNCVFLSNRASSTGGAIRAAGVLEVTGCTFDSNVADAGIGGAIQTGASSTITGSLFRANIGGAVEASAPLIVGNCTFTLNAAPLGGALRLTGASHSVSDCTISGNSCTVSGGGVMIFAGSAPQFRNTIVAGNTGPEPDVGGAVVSLGFNLIGNASGSAGFGTPGSHDQVGSPGTPINANLAALGDYGGATRTMPPRPGSPAIDQGNSDSSVDQRGRARPYDQVSVPNMTDGDGSDIGAYELRPSVRTVTTLADAGAGSLRQAVADLHPYDADSIKFAANVKGTITLTSGVITCAKPGVIDGPGSWDLAISGNDASRVFSVNQDNTFAIENLTITGGREYDGMAVIALGNVALRNCRIVGNHVIPDQFALGGVIREVPPASLVLENCTVANNTTGFGGGVFTGLGPDAGGSASINNCTISGNSGAGIVSSGSATTVLNSTITNNNTAGSDGGGIWHLQGPALLLGSTIVAGNLGPADVAGAFSSQGYNLVGKVGAASGLVHNVNHDRVGTVASPIAPVLGPLFMHGGPGETHAVLVGSPAIDKGRAFRPLDQRSAARYDDPFVANEFDGSDIGAFERNPTTPVAVDPLPSEASLALASARPNPAAGGVTAFASRLGTTGAVTLDMYNVAGRRVRSLVATTRPAGSYTDVWDGRDDDGRAVQAGVYFARLVAGDRSISKNFVVLP